MAFGCVRERGRGGDALAAGDCRVPGTLRDCVGQRASAGEDARDPAGRSGNSAKEIFGCFRVVLTAKPSSRTPRAESIQGRYPAASFEDAHIQRFVHLTANA